MTLIRAFIMICALACGLTELSPKNREFHSPTQQRQYHSFHVGQSNKSYEQEFRIPREYGLGKEFRYETVNPVPSEPEMRVFRTRGRGKAIVHRRGEMVYVPNELGRKKVNKGTKVVETNVVEIKSKRHRGGCRECPSDQTVVTARGNTFVLLPEPCPTVPRMWNHHSGPKPGSKIQEGLHVIRGTMGPTKKFCEYSYQVLVNRCEPLKAKEKDTTIECSAENVWGSICIISCGAEKEALGPTETECKEDLSWSNPMPICKGKTDCPTPKIKTKSKIYCQASNTSLIENDYLPSGSTCRFNQNGKEISLTCKDGRWLKSRKSEIPMAKQNKQNIKQKPSKNDPCNPNPCQNGGTCLKPESKKGLAICKCRPQTQGMHCELRECYYNPCENDGLCIYQNDEGTCYCPSEYGGDRCQNYKIL